MTTSNATHRTGSLGRTQIVWLAFMAAMTAFGAFFVFTSPAALTAPKAAITTPLTDGDTGIREGVAPLGWLQIVIHDSGLHFEDHENIDRRHRADGLSGIGFHFVVGNGTGRLGDGAIVATNRWADQRAGAHVAATLDGGKAALETADAHNRVSIGICLVGDGDGRAFTPAQLNSLESLVAELQGQYGIADGQVVLHRDISDVASPGRFFPAAEFEQFLAASRP